MVTFYSISITFDPHLTRPWDIIETLLYHLDFNKILFLKREIFSFYSLFKILESKEVPMDQY